MNPFPSRAKKTYPVCLAHINFNHCHHPLPMQCWYGQPNIRAREWNVYFAPGDMCPWIENVKESTLHAMGGGVSPDASEGTFFSLGTDPENRLMHGIERLCFVFWCVGRPLTTGPMLSSPHGARSHHRSSYGATVGTSGKHGEGSYCLWGHRGPARTRT